MTRCLMMVRDERVKHMREELEPGVTMLYSLSDGESMELPDGKVIRCRIEVDQDTQINDFDCYGRVEWVGRDRESARPAGFNGAACKLWARDAFWWQPPSDLKPGDDAYASLRAMLPELVEYGFIGVVVELCEGHDRYGKPIVIDFESLWGIDDSDDSNVREVSRELIREILSRNEEVSL